MNIKKILIVILSITIYSCGCNDDGFESYELSEFEKNIIPFTSEQNTQFINQTSELTDAVITAKTVDHINLNSSDDESCMVTLVESHSNKLILNETDQEFLILIAKSKSETEFNIVLENKYFGIQSCETISESIQPPTTDYESDGFSFENVFIFELCGNESLVSTIVYSTLNGIEFIKFENGNYLKRTE